MAVSKSGLSSLIWFFKLLQREESGRGVLWRCIPELLEPLNFFWRKETWECLMVISVIWTEIFKIKQNYSLYPFKYSFRAFPTLKLQSRSPDLLTMCVISHFGRPTLHSSGVGEQREAEFSFFLFRNDRGSFSASDRVLFEHDRNC